MLYNYVIHVYVNAFHSFGMTEFGASMLWLIIGTLKYKFMGASLDKLYSSAGLLTLFNQHLGVI